VLPSSREKKGIHLKCAVFNLLHAVVPSVVVPRDDPVHGVPHKVYVDGLGEVELCKVDKVDVLHVGVGLGAVVHNDIAIDAASLDRAQEGVFTSALEGGAESPN
jgi:hypothetical protein